MNSVIFDYSDRSCIVFVIYAIQYIVFLILAIYLVRILVNEFRCKKINKYLFYFFIVIFSLWISFITFRFVGGYVLSYAEVKKYVENENIVITTGVIVVERKNIGWVVFHLDGKRFKIRTQASDAALNVDAYWLIKDGMCVEMVHAEPDSKVLKITKTKCLE